MLTKSKSWLWWWAPLAMLSLLPTMSNFLGNRYQVSVHDLILPVILNLAAAALVAAVFYRLWRRDQVAGYAAGIITAVLFGMDYDDRLEAITPLFQAIVPLPALEGAELAVFSLIFMALIITGAYWAGRGLSVVVAARRWKVTDVVMGATIAITATFLFKFVPLAWNVAVEWPQFFYEPPKIAAAPATAKTAAKPDIYYIVLDRYASGDVLKSQFGYDNADFFNYLRENGYHLNPSSHSNYPYTTMSVASTMQADYLNDIIGKFGGSSQQTMIPFDETIRNSPTAQALQAIGYRYSLIGNWYETSNLSDVADETYQQTGLLTVLGQTVTLNNFAKNVLIQSPFWQFVQGGLDIGGFKVLTYENLGDVDMTRYALQSLKTVADQPAGGRFTFAHFLVPHEPFYFNADGSLNTDTGADNEGASAKQKYLNQVKYINGQMKEILSKIKAKSQGKAVVVLQADEGPYPFQLNNEVYDEASIMGEVQAGDMRNWSGADLRMKYGNLAAYHIPAANLEQDPAGADTVNVFRLILNSYFGYQLPYLPDCVYAYPNGRDKPLLFVDITKRLTGQAPDSRCQNNGTIKQ